VTRVALGCAAGFALAGLAGCGDAKGSGEAQTTAGGKGATARATGDLTVDIASFKYAPPAAVVSKGATVSFVNKDKAPHTATAQDGSFDTKRLEKGQKGDVTLDEAGTFTYICEYHRFMEAKITVK
jgi:plastocyanin